MPVKPIPDGYHTVTPVLTVRGAAKLIEFVTQAFDAKEVYRLVDSRAHRRRPTGGTPKRAEAWIKQPSG